MLIALIFIFVGLGGAIVETKPGGRIVGGEDAAFGEFPFMVSIRGLNGPNKHGCGGSILSENLVLTAAHCMHSWEDRPDLFTVQYGVIEINEKEPNVLQVKKIIIHEKFVHSGSYPNDIGILEIDGKFIFGDNVQPVRLPTPFQDPGFDVDVQLIGWGLDKTGGRFPMFLKKVILKRFYDEYCKSAAIMYIPDMHICAGIYGGGKGQCTADSGGPLIVDGVQYGIVSWSTKPCASPGNPGIFTKVAHQRDWIKLHTGI